jgi:hypothetical protein
VLAALSQGKIVYMDDSLHVQRNVTPPPPQKCSCEDENVKH